MGRYYRGDIEGKFAFGVQDSFAADRFGVEATLFYQFDDSHMPLLDKELSMLEEKIDIEDVNEYHDGPEGDSLIGIQEKDHSDYADYILGRKILECLELNYECMFEVEQ